MKNDIRKSGVLLLIAIYCFAIGNITKSISHYNIQNTQATEQQEYFATVSTNLFCHTSQSETSLSSFNDFPSPSFKNSFNSLWAINKTAEQSFERAFSQYTFIYRNFLIRYRKANIIFPFHCFW